MPYGECKIYSDGGHYIAIPHTTNHCRRRKKPPEEEITVVDERQNTEETGALSNDGNAPVSPAKDTPDEVFEPADIAPQNDDTGAKTERKTTRKELFEELYAANRSVKKWKRRKTIISAMRPYFESEEKTINYVDTNLQRKQRNLISRRVRMVRKVNLQGFNYFVTFTYDGQLHSENSFRKGLKSTLSNFSTRRGWKYVGVWERSPEKKRRSGFVRKPHNARRQNGDQQIHRHARQRHDQFISPAMLIVSRIDLNRPSPAESDEQQQQKSDRIDVRHRIQRNSSLQSRRRISQHTGRLGVSELVK